MSSKIPFSYELRPAKQIERKLIIETLNELRMLNYPISKYRYIGMPSITYYDFILFHKYLYIEDMIWFESRDIPKRMDFNKPYDFIKIKNGNFSLTYKPSHFTQKKCILWLDYEKTLSKEWLDDIGDITSNYLKLWSIIIVTSPVRYPDDDVTKQVKFNAKLEEFGNFLIYWPDVPNINHVSSKNLFLIIYRAIRAKIHDSWLRRTDNCRMLPLFNITYNDGGCEMFSAGFIIDDAEKILTAKKFFSDRNFPTFKDVDIGYNIEIPTLTHKERKLMDQQKSKINRYLQRSRSLKDATGLELKNEEFVSYMRNARHYPNYQEGII